MATVIQPTISEVEGVTVRFPQALLVASREDAPQFQKRVMIQTLGSLYAQGKISSGLGAQVLGCNRWEFYQLLSEHSFSVLDYAEDEQAGEAKSSHELAALVSH